jgi:type I restriction enzyme S subunit
MRLPLPSRKEQDRIADIAGALDDKIELNRRMNETLEAMARALFQSWFIDFDPVHAKAARRQPDGLDPATAKLFPSEFELSSVGRIPKGWKVGKLSDHVEAMKGLSYKGEGLAEAGTGIPLHNLNSVYEGGGYKFSGIKWYTGEYKERHLIRPGDLIVANTEQGHDCLLLGYAAIVPEVFGEPAIFSHHLYRLRVRDDSPVTVDYLCRMLNSPQMHDLVSGYGNGTTVNMLPADGLQVPEFVVPPPQLIQRYSEYAESVRKRCERFVVENQDLANTRDTLLPRLLSGDCNCHSTDREAV